MLTVNKVWKSFGGFVAISDVSFSVEKHATTAVIGPNGAGKSTLFNLITGHLRPDAGAVLFEKRNITGERPYNICRYGLGRSFQRTNIFPRLTVFENIQAAHIAHRGVGSNIWAAASSLFREETELLLCSLGLETEANAIASSLSHGNQKQIEIGLALAGKPNFLLLDEPTAGMSARETRETMTLLERIIEERGVTLLFTEHDMDVVFSVAKKVLVLHQGSVIAQGTPTEVRADREVRRVYLGERQ
jgi:branched-chain amino acid transport system ATP-binding protein